MTTLTAGDGTDLFLHDWSVPDAKATVALLHGYGEHAGRYAEMAEGFNAKGISVIAVDLRGHGKSAGLRGHVDRFSDYYLDAKSQCAGGRGSCPDSNIRGGKNDVRLLNSAIINDFTMLTFR